VVGGRALDGGNTAVVEAFDVATGTWHAVDPLLQARSGHGLAVMGGKLYAVGGENLLNNTALSSVEEYDPATGAWRAVRALPSPRTGHGTAAIGNSIHGIGGSDHNHATRSTNLVFRLQ
jgi:N-acetylneuraminic acid mutarotase